MEREAITILRDAGWQTDAEWLGPLAVKSLGSAGSAEAMLDFFTDHNFSRMDVRLIVPRTELQPTACRAVVRTSRAGMG